MRWHAHEPVQLKTMIEVMNLALTRTNTMDAVDYVNAHATGTVQGDAEEALAIGAIGISGACGSLKGHLGTRLRRVGRSVSLRLK